MINLKNYSKLLVHQVYEVFEFLGYETRNKYEILDENKNKVGFAAEQGKGIFGFLLRQYLGHWRNFDVHFFNNDRQLMMKANHPFRFYFERFNISDANGNHIGALERRFSLLTKKFDVLNEHGDIILEMRSPIWKIWTFPFYENGQEIAKIQKKWSGGLTEFFTDKDNFLVDFGPNDLDHNTRLVILAASVFVDLRFFENKAQ